MKKKGKWRSPWRYIVTVAEFYYFYLFLNRFITGCDNKIKDLLQNISDIFWFSSAKIPYSAIFYHLAFW